MKIFIYLILFYFFNTFLANAGGPWDNQYCNIKTTTIKIMDKEGKIVDEKTEEKVVCDDGVKDFLHGMGIADNCQFFTLMNESFNAILQFFNIDNKLNWRICDRRMIQNLSNDI